jgi:hypothetical protein
LVHTVRDWRPPSFKTELEYRNHLFDYLRESVPDDTRVEKEYRHSGTTLDLFLSYKGALGTSTEVFFELKRNLTKKVEFDRLVGQIEGMLPDKHIVFVVLVGDLDESLVGRLKSKYSERISIIEVARVRR